MRLAQDNNNPTIANFSGETTTEKARYAKKEFLRAQILELVEQYGELASSPKEFIPGKTLINFAGRVFDERELVSLVNSSLDFWLTSGRESTLLESKLAKFVGVEHCLLVNSGSSANLLAFSTLTSPKLKERRIHRGDEVITVAAGFPTTVSPIIQYGAVPVFVDVALPWVNVDVSQLEAARSNRTKAVMLAHTLGNPFDIDAVVDFCHKYNLWLIEDNCDALGSQYNSKTSGKRRTGSFGDLSTSSFYPAHHITTGEGGAVFTSNDLLAEIAESIRDWGRDCYCAPGKSNTCGQRFCRQFGSLPSGYDHKYTYSHFGYNLKMTDLQAAIGNSQVDKLPIFTQKRRQNYLRLKKATESSTNEISVMEATYSSDPSWFGMLIWPRVGSKYSRDEIVRKFENKKIQTRMLFAGNLTRQPCFDEMRNNEDGFRIVAPLENTDFLMNNAMWIGVYPGLDEPRMQYVEEAIHDIFD